MLHGCIEPYNTNQIGCSGLETVGKLLRHLKVFGVTARTALYKWMKQLRMADVKSSCAAGAQQPFMAGENYGFGAPLITHHGHITCRLGGIHHHRNGTCPSAQRFHRLNDTIDIALVYAADQLYRPVGWMAKHSGIDASIRKCREHLRFDDALLFQIVKRPHDGIVLHGRYQYSSPFEIHAMNDGVDGRGGIGGKGYTAGIGYPQYGSHTIATLLCHLGGFEYFTIGCPAISAAATG